MLNISIRKYNYPVSAGDGYFMKDKRLQRIIGDNIKRIRKLRGLSQSDLAEEMNISDSFCAAVENGNKGLGVSNLVKMAGILNVPVDALTSDKHSRVRFNELEMRCRDKSDEFAHGIENMAIKWINLLEIKN